MITGANDWLKKTLATIFVPVKKMLNNFYINIIKTAYEKLKNFYVNMIKIAYERLKNFFVLIKKTYERLKNSYVKLIARIKIYIYFNIIYNVNGPYRIVTIYRIICLILAIISYFFAMDFSILLESFLANILNDFSENLIQIKIFELLNNDTSSLQGGGSAGPPNPGSDPIIVPNPSSDENENSNSTPGRDKNLFKQILYKNHFSHFDIERQQYIFPEMFHSRNPEWSIKENKLRYYLEIFKYANREVFV